MICVAELTVNTVAATPPNFTLVAPVRFDPVITTCVPAGPVGGVNDEMTGPPMVISRLQPPAIEPESTAEIVKHEQLPGTVWRPYR